jgi:FkbM family methyltransferase
VPPTGSTLDALHSRLLLQYHRLALSWQAMREGRGRAVTLRHDEGLVRIDDGVRQIYAPRVQSVGYFRNGVNARLDAVAEKYLGHTGYLPREGDVIVDVGAGIGEFTLWCANAGAKLVAIEPDPLAFACLERNTVSLANVQILSCALWKERADLRLHGSADTTESSLIEDGRAHARNTDVEAWPLDQLPAVTSLPVIDLMKVDGEGVEPEILMGGIRALRRIRILAIDVGATDRRPNLKARVEAVLEAQNFRSLPHDRSDTILALNTAMVGPFNSHAFGLRDS